MPVEFQNETLKTELAYALRTVSEKTKNIAKIIESGRLAVLKVKNNGIQSIIVCPYVKLIPDIRKFILFLPNDKGVEGARLLPEEIPLRKLPEKDYLKLSEELGFKGKFITV